jgi:hypothetical protein
MLKNSSNLSPKMAMDPKATTSSETKETTVEKDINSCFNGKFSN